MAVLVWRRVGSRMRIARGRGDGLVCGVRGMHPRKGACRHWNYLRRPAIGVCSSSSRKLSLGLEDTRTVGWASYDARGCQCVVAVVGSGRGGGSVLDWTGLDWSW